jgi:ATP-dependent 26S proteasome regulatory subunit
MRSSAASTKEMNAILETLDGVTAKNAEVITVFTTNFPEKINGAFLRSGRVDIEIELLPPDAEAAGRFVQHIAGEYLAPDVDLELVGMAFADLVPADITNGINQAKTRAIGVHGADIKGRVDTDMLVIAGEVMKKKTAPRGDGLTQADRDLAVVKASQRILSVPQRVELGPDMLAVPGDVKKIKKQLGA